MVDVDEVMEKFRDVSELEYESFETVYGLKSLIANNGYMDDIKPLEMSYRDQSLSFSGRKDIYSRNMYTRAHAVVDGQVFYGLENTFAPEIRNEEINFDYLENLEIEKEITDEKIRVYSIHEPLEDDEKVEEVNQAFRHIYNKALREEDEFT